MNGQRHSKEKAKKNGFYLALAVCLVAVGIAAWSTYDAVHGYLGTEGDTSSTVSVTASMTKQEEEDVRKGQSAVPGDDEDPETSRNATSREESSAPAKQTAGEVSQSDDKSSKPDEEDGSKAGEKETGTPVNAGALYEISTRMIFPTESGEIAKAYSVGTPVYSETMKDWRIHAGIDVKAEDGGAVRACGNGMVKESYTDGLLGNVLVVEHGDYLFYYCGLGENIPVKAGDIVTMGQEIGQVTAVPFESAEGAHVHLEVKRDDVFLNPQELLDSGEDSSSSEE